MTRKEQILQAARNYDSRVTFSSPSDVIHFGYGAKWADEHPNLERFWHDASEEPKCYYIILFDGLDNMQWVENYQHIDISYANWKDYTDAFNVIRWAYVKDLFPKVGER